MITTVVFDIGNVLIDFHFASYVRELLRDEEAVRHVTDALITSGGWNELDLGKDTEEVISGMLKTEPEYQPEIRKTLAHIGGCISRTEYAIPWIQDLKKRGYRVLYLSNYSRFIMDVSRDALDFLPYMDGGVFSCSVRCVKPDPGIYQILAESYSLDPAECVFIDDLEENGRAAEAFGMHYIQFKSYEQAKEELLALISPGCS